MPVPTHSATRRRAPEVGPRSFAWLRGAAEEVEEETRFTESSSECDMRGADIGTCGKSPIF
eukprot:CAMPEP_0118635280 /NCGR_PEP_ID=MMETSP0785-20121206/1993_1 /TAXON_ID=91992 /ORGANISM="Bolidomonas pacifica, Strain CCMP 1866" /LENGTH=60 /DNA_ID=CAMNT_0006526305 /DNA_START=1021 /DNA_END=1200 /DNA_ORIENTATION=+